MGCSRRLRVMFLMTFLAVLGTGCEHPPEKSVELEITGSLEEAERKKILEQLKGMTDGSSHFLTSSHSGTILTVTLSPVSDVDAFSKKIDFGKVERVEGRKVFVKIEPIAGFDIQDIEAFQRGQSENDGGPGAGASEGIPAPAAEIP